MNLTISEGARQKTSFKHKYLSINRIDHELTNKQSDDLLKPIFSNRLCFVKAKIGISWSHKVLLSQKENHVQNCRTDHSYIQ